MKNQEKFAELSRNELEEKLRHFKEELFNLRFQAVTGQLTNPSRISFVRKNIARVNTFLARIEKTETHTLLKAEYDALVKSKGINPKVLPLRERVYMLKTQLSHNASKVRREIKSEVDSKVQELLKSIREKISEKLKSAKGKDEANLRASSRRLRDPEFKIRKKFLDKLASLGLNEASQIKSLKEAKREKLGELDRIRVLQHELTIGHLPF